MASRCEYVEPVTGQRCPSEATIVAPRLEFGVIRIDAEMCLCRRHHDELWMSAVVGRPQAVATAGRTNS
jgi:hypothetical protein